MKESKAIIQPFLLEGVLEVLEHHPELPGLTVSHVAGGAAPGPATRVRP